jgi:uncharacterized protein
VANRLATETSPYLLQHKDNPVEWYPWGEEALARARSEDKPLLVSIGYSACHWCHVMEHESFEDPGTAEVMNELFVNIKVDREERPDLDGVFMAAVQAMTGHGGWPLNVFLTPGGVPFYGGTYFPPSDRHGIPSWTKVLRAVHDAYANRRDEVEQSAGRIADFLRRANGETPDRETLRADVFADAVANLDARFDEEWGGFGDAPKFPQASVLVALLHLWKRTGDPRAEEMLRVTLDRMAAGGIYDHVGGGFHRYAVDRVWLVPHFEKMLYDNAQLARVYLDAWRAFADPAYARVAIETLDWVVREMTGPEGQFYATLDADSEGEEGKFYVWTPEEFDAVLGADLARIATAWFGVEPGGNFEGKTILNTPRPADEVAAELGIAAGELRERVDQAISALYEAREQRVRPGRDDKAIAGWNGMMLKAFAEAGRALNRPDYLEVAERNADFILTRLRQRGRFHRSYKDGQAKVGAFLEDFANTIDGLLSLHAATLEPRWLEEALSLAGIMEASFGDPKGVGFYDTSALAEELVARPRDLQDGATPSGNAVAADVLLRIGAMTGDDALTARAAALLESLARPMAEQPLGFGRFLAALDFHLAAPQEVALAGPRDDPRMDDLLDVVFSGYRPNLLVGYASGDPELAQRVPFLADRPARGGAPTAYVCERFACMAPVTDPDALVAQLDRGTGLEWGEF